MREEVLRMERITYREQGNTLLENFNLTIQKGEILGLVPVNHYGMSALIRLLQQNRPLHYGFVYYNEKLVNHWRRHEVSQNKIALIQNKSCLAEGLTVADNIFVLRPGFKKWLLNRKVLETQLAAFFEEIQIQIPADTYVDTLTPFEKFVTELLRAVVAGSRLVILDRIRGFVSDAEMQKVHRIIRHYAKQGISFLYIASHFEETRQICDRTALMMNGQIMKYFTGPEMDLNALFLECVEDFEKKVKEQIGKQSEFTEGRDVAFEAVDLCCKGQECLNFSVAQGECLVLQDMDNHVFPDLIQVLSGEKSLISGSIRLGGAPFMGEKSRDIAIVQTLPTQTMLFSNMSYMDNLCFAMDHRVPEVWKQKRIKQSIRNEYGKFLGEKVFELSIEQLTERQKYELVYARILLQNPKVVFCVQPFHGAEVTLRLRVWELLKMLLKKGIAVVILAVNLADSLALAHRLVRVRDGKTTEYYEKEDFPKLPVDTPWHYLYAKKETPEEER